MALLSRALSMLLRSGEESCSDGRSLSEFKLQEIELRMDKAMSFPEDVVRHLSQIFGRAFPQEANLRAAIAELKIGFVESALKLSVPEQQIEADWATLVLRLAFAFTR